MTQYIKLPSGEFYPGPDGVPVADIWRKAYADYPEKFNSAQGPQEGFIPAVKASTARGIADSALVAQKLGLAPEQMAQTQQQLEDYAQRTFKPTEGGWLDSPWAKFKETLGGSAYYAAPALGVAALPTGVLPTAAGLGIVAGASALNYTGSNLRQQMETGKTVEETDLAKAALTSVSQTAIDLVALRMIPGLRSIFGEGAGKISTEQAKKMAEEALRKTAADYALQTGKAVTAEGLNEVATQALARAQAGMSLTDEDARKDFFENFMGGASFGAVFGPAGRFKERSRAIGEARDQMTMEAAAAEKQQRDAAEAAATTPEALMALQQRFTEQQAQYDSLAAAAKAKLPKDATPEDVLAKTQAVEAYKAFKADPAWTELNKEYRSRAGLLKPLLQQQKDAEKAAAEQAAAAAEQAKATAFQQTTEGIQQNRYNQQSIPGVEPMPLDQNAREAQLQAEAERQGTAEPKEDPQYGQKMRELEQLLAAAQQKESEAAGQGDMETWRKLRQQSAQIEKEQAEVRARMASQGATPEQVREQAAKTAAQIAKLQQQFKDQSGPGYDPAKAEKLAAKIEALQAQQAELGDGYQQQDLLGGVPLTRGYDKNADPFEAYRQREQDDLQAQNRKQQPDLLADWKESLEQDETLRKEGDDERLTELALGRGPNPDAPSLIDVPDTIKPDKRAVPMLQKLDALESAVLTARREASEAAQVGNRAGATAAAARQEAAQTTLAQLKQVKDAPFIETVVGLRAEQDRHLFDIEESIQDLAAGRTLDQENKGEASTTRALLLKKIQRMRNQYSAAMLQEAGTIRRATGALPMTEQEARGYVRKVNDTLNEWVTRAMADPKELAKEWTPVEPAQYRSDKLIREAKFAMVDQRPLKERQFGRYSAAVEVLKEQLRNIRVEATSVKNRGVRVKGSGEKPFLAKQDTQAEASKVAEAKGETAKTAEGELRRKREYVGNQIEQALRSGNVPSGVRPLLERAQTLIENGTASRDVLDAASNIAERTAYDALKDEGTALKFSRASGEAQVNTADSVISDKSSRVVSEPTPVLREKRQFGTESRLSSSDVRELRDALRARDDVATEDKQGDLFGGKTAEDKGFIRATPANFEKAAAAVRAKIAKTNALSDAIKVEMKRIDREREQGRLRLEEIESALATTNWSREQYGNMRDYRKDDIGLPALAKKVAAARQSFGEAQRSAKAMQDAMEERVVTPALQKALDSAEAKVAALEKQLAEAQKAQAEAIKRFAFAMKFGSMLDRHETLMQSLRKQGEGLRSEQRELASDLRPEPEKRAQRMAELNTLIGKMRTELERQQKTEPDSFVPLEAAIERRQAEVNALVLPRQTPEQVRAKAAPLKDAAQRQAEARRKAETAVEQQREKAAARTAERTKQEQARLERLAAMPSEKRTADGRRESLEQSAARRAEEAKARAEEQRVDTEAAEENALERRMLRNKNVNIAQDNVAALQAALNAKKAEYEASNNKRTKAKLLKEGEKLNTQLTIAKGQLDVVRNPSTRMDRQKAYAKQSTLYSSKGVGKTVIDQQKAAIKNISAKDAARQKQVAKILADAKEAMDAEKNGDDAYNYGDASWRTGDSKGGIDLPSAQKRMDELQKTLPAGVKLVYAPTLEAAPIKFFKAAAAKGLTPEQLFDKKGVTLADGTIIVIGDHHASMLDLEETIAHEVLGHSGVEAVLGKDGLIELLKKVDARPDGLLGLADELGVRAEVQATLEAAEANGDKPEQARLEGLQELIAYTSEQRVTESFRQKASRWIKELIGAVREALRKMGLMELAKADTNDIYKVLRDAHRAFKNGDIGASRNYSGGTRFRTGRVTKELAGAYAISQRVVAPEASWAQKLDSTITGRNLIGLNAEVNFVDQYAPFARIAQGMKDALAGVQMMYYLRMTGQRHNLLSQVIGHGPLELKEVKRKDGRKEWMYQAQENGPNLAHVNETLAAAHKMTGSPQVTSNLFSLYSVAKRAENVGLDKLDYSGKLTQADLNTAMQQIRAVPGLKEVFDKAHDEYQKVNRGLLDFAVQTGYLSEAKAKEFMQNDDYVPYYREDTRGGVGMFIGGEEMFKIGNVRDESWLAPLVGDNNRIIDFNTAAVANANMWMELGLRNQAAKNAAFQLSSMGMATVGNTHSRRGPDVFNFRDHGVEKHALVQTGPDIPAELLVKGMEGIPAQMSLLVRMLGVPSQWVRTLFVANPVSAVRNLFRDVVSSTVASGSGFDGTLAAMRNVGAATLTRRGVAGGEVFTGLPSDMANVLREISTGKEGSISKLFTRGHVIHSKADAFARQLRYESYIKQGLSDMEATYMALESMNFTRRGISPSIHLLNILNPFINAQIQGLSVISRAIRGKMPMNERLEIRNRLITRGLMIAGLSMLYASLMQDDETYKNATPDQRYGNWFLPNPFGGEMIRAPIPFEVGAIFKALPEALVNYMQGNDADAYKGLMFALRQTIPGYSTYGIPQALRPAIEAVANYSFYTGRSLESRQEGTLVPGMRTRPNTSGLVDAIGEQLNISPIRLQQLISGYTGTLGLAVTQIAGMPFKDGAEMATARTSQMPLTGTFFQPMDAGGVLNQAYEVMQEAKQVRATYDNLLNKGRPDEARAFLERNATAFARASMADNFEGVQNKLTQQMRAVQNSDLSPDKKRELLDKLQKVKTDQAAAILRVATQVDSTIHQGARP